MENECLDKVELEKINETYIRIHTSSSTLRELSEELTFQVPGYAFTPSYRMGIWDGKIRCINLQSKQCYLGLYEHIHNFCKKNNYEYIFNDDKKDFTEEDARKFISSLNLPSYLEIRDYQLNAFIKTIQYKRLLLLSATSSGKSLLIYYILRYLNLKTLILVPTLGLVEQLYSDFESYGYDVEKHVHKIYSGKDKDSNHLIYCSTWQSLFKMPKEYFHSFDVIIADEAHLYHAKSIKAILENCINAKYRIGTTGTLSNAKCHSYILEGLLGPIENVVKTKELMDNNIISQLKIENIVFNYSKESKKLVRKMTYDEEIKFIICHSIRNSFIKNLSLSLKGNVLILFNYVEDHGIPLYELISKNTNRDVYFVSGKTKIKDRNEIRNNINDNNNSISICSVGTFSTGINIPNIHYIIYVSPTKSKIRILQSIGRGLRKGTNKDKFIFYDLSDDLSNGRKLNYTLKHSLERLQYYRDEGFDVNSTYIDLEN